MVYFVMALALSADDDYEEVTHAPQTEHPGTPWSERVRPQAGEPR